MIPYFLFLLFVYSPRYEMALKSQLWYQLDSDPDVCSYGRIGYWIRLVWDVHDGIRSDQWMDEPFMGLQFGVSISIS